MPYVDFAGLSRFDGKLKDFASSACAGPDMANWQKTSEAGAVSFSPVPEMPLDPVVNFAFTETGPASGTKGPDNPSTITGVTQAKVTRCGKNLLNMAGVSGFTRDGITFTVDSSAGTVTVSGTATATVSLYVSPWPKFKLYAGQQYFLSGCPSGGSVDTYYLGGAWYSEEGNYGGAMPSDTGSGALLSRDANWHYNCIIRVVSGTTVSNLVFRPQLELGSVVTSFEPYDGADYAVNLGSTYFGGSVDLSTGTMTVTWWGHVFDGTEQWRENGTVGANYRHWVRLSENGFPNPVTGSVYQLCTHCLYNYSFNNALGYFFSNSVESGGGIFFCDKNAIYSTTESWVNWIASEYANGHPVTVVYTLAAPFTVQLSPQQILSLSQPDPYAPRTNTVYSDQISVQVGYPKSPQASQTELTNAIVSLGGNV